MTVSRTIKDVMSQQNLQIVNIKISNNATINNPPLPVTSTYFWLLFFPDQNVLPCKSQDPYATLEDYDKAIERFVCIIYGYNRFMILC